MEILYNYVTFQRLFTDKQWKKDQCGVKDKNACNVLFGRNVREAEIEIWTTDAGVGATVVT